MSSVPRFAPLIALAAALIQFSACSTEPIPPPPPKVEDTRIDIPPPPPPAEWNVFPNFVTGKIDIYHNGSYYGSIDGDETGDPPEPHKRPSQDTPDSY